LGFAIETSLLVTFVPIVDEYVSSKSSYTNFFMRLVFPTQDSPTRQIFSLRRFFCGTNIILLPPKFTHLPLKIRISVLKMIIRPYKGGGNPVKNTEYREYK
jgi:hypothetical protein